MVERPVGMNQFEFVIISALRAKQLMRGSIPRVAVCHKVITTAQTEVATGKVAKADPIPAAALL